MPSGAVASVASGKGQGRKSPKTSLHFYSNFSRDFLGVPSFVDISKAQLFNTTESPCAAVLSCEDTKSLRRREPSFPQKNVLSGTAASASTTALSLKTKPKQAEELPQSSKPLANLLVLKCSVDLRGIRIRRSVRCGGLGLFATRDFDEGEVIFEIPRELCIEVKSEDFDRADEPTVLWRAAQNYDVDAFLDAKAKKAVLALSQQLLLERQQGSTSKFAEYLAVLPDPSALNPLQERWPPELENVGGKLLSRMHRTIYDRDNACMEDLLPFERVWKTRLWSLSSVWTRAVQLENESNQHLALVPLMDFINHWIPSEGSTETWSCYYEVFSDAVAVLAERQIARGEELTFLYGQFSDAQLLCNYGICPDLPGRNAWDEAPVSIGPYVLTSPAWEEAPDGSLVAARAALWPKKLIFFRTKDRACLSRHGWTLEGTLIFTVPKDIRPSGGLLALARLLSLETVEEVEKMEDQIFWMDLPGGAAKEPLDLSLEERAWERILEWLDEALQKATMMASDATDQMLQWPMGTSRDLAEALASVQVGEAAALARSKDAALARLQRLQRRQGKELDEDAWRRRQEKMKMKQVAVRPVEPWTPKKTARCALDSCVVAARLQGFLQGFLQLR
eukprot:symbB.v1.2.001415.t1/scaffold74.1/size352168/8